MQICNDIDYFPWVYHRCLVWEHRVRIRTDVRQRRPTNACLNVIQTLHSGCTPTGCFRKLSTVPSWSHFIPLVWFVMVCLTWSSCVVSSQLLFYSKRPVVLFCFPSFRNLRCYVKGASGVKLCLRCIRAWFEAHFKTHHIFRSFHAAPPDPFGGIVRSSDSRHCRVTRMQSKTLQHMEELLAWRRNFWHFRCCAEF